jgi:uncharacterized protein YcgI (DUF1989 family)
MTAPHRHVAFAALAAVLVTPVAAPAQPAKPADRVIASARAALGQQLAAGLVLDAATLRGNVVDLRLRHDTAYEMLPSQSLNAARGQVLDDLSATLCRDADTQALFAQGGTVAIKLVSKDAVVIAARRMTSCERTDG